MSIWLVLWAGCKPGTGFDDVPGTGTEGDADADADADSDADSDSDTDTDTGPDETGDTGLVPVSEPSTIQEVQQGAWAVGTEVDVTGVVTAVGPDGVFVQDPAGGPYSGVFVRLGAGFAGVWGTIVEDDLLEITGQVTEDADRTTLDVVVSSVPAVVIGVPGAAPAPEVLSVDALAADPEPWEGVLVTVTDAVTSAVGLPVDAFELQDFAGLGSVRIDSALWLWSGQAALAVGDRFASVTGPLDFVGGFELLPRRDADVVPMPVPELVINEILADPVLDANCDGVVDTVADEFVELWNVGPGDANLSLVELSDSAAVRHTFAPGTIVPPGGAIVVFGGGTPTFDGTGVAGTWCAALPGTVQVVAGGALSLANLGDTVTASVGDATIDTVTYGAEANGGQSINRDPELGVGALVQHTTLAGAVNAFSPGTLVGGVPAAFSFTPTVDGDPAEWPASTAFATSAGTTTRLGWDAAALHLAVTHPDVATGGADRWLVVYLGAGTLQGTTTGVPLGAQTPNLPFAAAQAVQWRADDGTSTLWEWNGAAWVATSPWLGTGGSVYAVDTALETVEVSLPLSLVGATDTLEVVVAWVDETAGTTYAATPATAITDGAADPDYAQGWRFSPRLATDPNAYAPVP